jgi:hypothetical protein
MPEATEADRPLRGCPFCCSRQVVLQEVEHFFQDIPDPSGPDWRVACLDCGCEGPPGHGRGEAEELWNKRPCEGS